MPYINVNVTKPVTDAQKQQIVAGLGEKITLIPGKSEAALMIEVTGDHAIYLAGEQRAESGYIDVKIYGTTAFEHKKAFTEAAFAVVSEATGIPQDAMYLNFSEYENWGTKGTLK